MTSMIFLIFIFSFAFARDHVPSFRPSNEDYKNYLTPNLLLNSPESETALSATQNIINEPWNNMTESDINSTELLDLFIEIRDQKPIQDLQGHSRRLTWLYPDDGCYARSAVAQYKIQSKNGTSDNGFRQIFVFGNLSAKTPNHPNGEVTWWYHVVPIVKTSFGVFVFDPSVEARFPLLIETWLYQLLPDRSDAKVSICSPATFNPYSVCASNSPIEFDFAVKEETGIYLDLEWARIEDLGRDPVRELGAEPPWFFLKNILKIY